MVKLEVINLAEIKGYQINHSLLGSDGQMSINLQNSTLKCSEVTKKIANTFRGLVFSASSTHCITDRIQDK